MAKLSTLRESFPQLFDEDVPQGSVTISIPIQALAGVFRSVGDGIHACYGDQRYEEADGLEYLRPKLERAARRAGVQIRS
jgi:hypothetical protein